MHRRIKQDTAAPMHQAQQSMDWPRWYLSQWHAINVHAAQTPGSCCSAQLLCNEQVIKRTMLVSDVLPHFCACLPLCISLRCASADAARMHLTSSECV